MFWLNYLEWTRHVDERNPAILHLFMQNCVTSGPHRPFQPIPTNISWWLSWYPSTDPIGRHHTGGAVQAALSVIYGSTNVSVCISVSVCIVNVKLLCNPPPPWMPYLTCCHWGLLCSVLGSWCYFRTHAFHMCTWKNRIMYMQMEITTSLWLQWSWCFGCFCICLWSLHLDVFKDCWIIMETFRPPRVSWELCSWCCQRYLTGTWTLQADNVRRWNQQLIDLTHYLKNKPTNKQTNDQTSRRTESLSTCMLCCFA